MRHICEHCDHEFATDPQPTHHCDPVAVRVVVLREALDAIPQTICTSGPNERHDPGCDDPTCPLLLVNNAIQALLDRPR